MAKSEYQFKGHAILKEKSEESGKPVYHTMGQNGVMEEHETLPKAKKSINEMERGK